MNRTLTLLDLSSNCIGPKGARLLSEGVQPNQTLQTLALSSNLLVGLNERNFGTYDASGLMALCAVVFPSEHTGYNTSLTTLDLGMNALGAEGAKVRCEQQRRSHTNTYVQHIRIHMRTRTYVRRKHV